MSRLPTLFVSHGAPTLVLEDSPARRFLAELGQALERPRAIVVVSAHWETDRPTVSTADRPETIHDFHGFPAELYALRYAALGAPETARRAATLIEAAGLGPTEMAARGLDHGAWVPLILIYPQADVPATQLSIQPGRGPRHHLALGEALRPLRDEGVLILASGSLTHNLAEMDLSVPEGEVPEWVSAFETWVERAVTQRRVGDLLDYRRLAPEARRNHPTEEHFLPLFAALGAASPGVAGRRLHTSRAYGVLSLDAYAFD